MKRYNIGYLGLEEHPKGRYVAHGDHLAVVQKLEERVRELEACYTNDLQGAYEKGYDEGHSVGYCKALSETDDLYETDEDRDRQIRREAKG